MRAQFEIRTALHLLSRQTWHRDISDRRFAIETHGGGRRARRWRWFRKKRIFDAEQLVAARLDRKSSIYFFNTFYFHAINLWITTRCTKNEWKFQTFQLGAQAGFLRGISNDMQISIADKFFLGGPLNLRGFEMRGCGPRDDGNAIGGNIYWALAFHVYTPLPFRPGRNSFGEMFRLHGFVNGGNLGNLAAGKGNIS